MEVVPPLKSTRSTKTARKGKKQNSAPGTATDKKQRPIVNLTSSRAEASLPAASAPDGRWSDADVFESARMQWQFGDWESLVKIDDLTLETHSERAKLALLVACAYQQMNDHGSARRLLHLCRAWGCDRKLIARLLVAGVHNTLGRTAALAREDERSLRHFREAVEGVAGDARLACQARSVREVSRLRLFDQAIDFIENQAANIGDQRGIVGNRSAQLPVANPIRSQLLLMRQDIARATAAPAERAAQLVEMDQPARRSPRNVQGKNAILIAGMRHSGSTALFNAVKLALEQKQIRFVSFYSEGKNNDLLNTDNEDLLLIKTHEFRDDVICHASTVITTRRDLRDTVASAKRRNFPLLRNMGNAIEYAKYNRTLHDVWLPYSDYEFVYETFMADPVTEIGRVFAHLGIQGADLNGICRQLRELPTDKYEVTLLSPLHITDPERTQSYGTTLERAVINKIESDHGSWLARYGYSGGESQ